MNFVFYRMLLALIFCYLNYFNYIKLIETYFSNLHNDLLVNKFVLANINNILYTFFLYLHNNQNKYELLKIYINLIFKIYFLSLSLFHSTSFYSLYSNHCLLLYIWMSASPFMLLTISQFKLIWNSVNVIFINNFRYFCILSVLSFHFFIKKSYSLLLIIFLFRKDTWNFKLLLFSNLYIFFQLFLLNNAFDNRKFYCFSAAVQGWNMHLYVYPLHTYSSANKLRN